MKREGDAEAAPTSALYNVVRTLVTFAFGVALALLVPRWLGPSAYATYSLLITLVLSGVALARLSLDTAASKFVAEMRGKGLPEAADRVARTLVRWEAVLCGVVCVGLVAVSPVLADRYSMNGRVGLVVLAALAVVPEAMGLVLAGVLKGLGRYGYLARVSFFIAPVSFGASVLVLRLGLGIAGLLGVRLLVSAVRVMFIQRCAHVAWRSSERENDELRARLFRFILLWSWLMVVSMVVWEQSELYFLGLYWPGDQVAFYALAFTLSSRAMALLPLAVGDVAVPAASRAFGRGGREALGLVYRSATRYLILLSMPVAAAGILLAGPIVSLGAGEAYGAAAPLLRALLVSACIGAVGQGSWAVLTAGEMRRFLVVMGTVAMVVNITLDVVLIPRFAAAGAVGANIAAQVLAVTVGAVYTCRAFRVSYPWASVVHALAGCVVAGASLVVVLSLIPAPWALIVGIPVAAVVYPVSLVMVGGLAHEDVEAARRTVAFLPAGVRGRLLAALRKHAR